MSETGTTSGVQLIDRFFTHLTTGEIEAALELFHPDSVIEEPAGLPYGGEYRGPEGFAELFGKVTSLYEFEIHEWRVEPFGDGAVGLLDATFTSRSSGEAEHLQVVEIYEFTDGKVSRATIFPRDTKAIADLAGNGEA